MSDKPIGHYAMLSDCHSAALVDRAGSIDWWCTPRFDSPSVFGRILDDRAGHFTIRPIGEASVDRSYLDGTLILMTTFDTEIGRLELTDALSMAPGVRSHELGVGSPHLLVRRARCTRGTVEVAVEFAPKHEYGLTTPILASTDDGAESRGGSHRLVVSSQVPLELGPDDGTLSATVTLTEGEEVLVGVQASSSWEPAPPRLNPEELIDRIEDTAEAWRSWEASHQAYQGPYAELVHTSGRILQGLTYQPSGAIVAAPTTSLPEVIGGERNWDYRYAWVRDASFTLNALWVAACPDEADRFLHYLTTSASSIHSRRELQIMFGIDGRRDLTERTLEHLGGWRDSAPVRVGNGAWHQRQIDVYGELLDAVHRLRDVIDPTDGVTSRFLVSLADAAADAWREADQGIWEVREEPRHYVYSKLMCWVALDRAIDLTNSLEVEPERVEAWSAEREEIREAILAEGWSDDANSFVQHFGSDGLDASNLMIPIVGFLAGDDPRVVATIEATEERLCDERGLVYRYRTDDGLAGEEGSFLLCTFWLAEAWALAGRVDRAREVFERAASYANDVGLLSEEVHPDSGELLGNFPQAFSHIGLVNAAWAIQQASS